MKIEWQLQTLRKSFRQKEQELSKFEQHKPRIMTSDYRHKCFNSILTKHFSACDSTKRKLQALSLVLSGCSRLPSSIASLQAIDGTYGWCTFCQIEFWATWSGDLPVALYMRLCEKTPSPMTKLLRAFSVVVHLAYRWVLMHHFSFPELYVPTLTLI